MKHWSIQKKLMSLCTGLIALVIISGGVGFWGSSRILSTKEELNQKLFPTILAASKMDGKQDEILGDVYQAFFFSKGSRSDDRKEVAAAIDEDIKNMRAHFEELEKLQTDGPTKDVLERLKPALDAYLKTAEETSAAALAGDLPKALSLLPDMREKYKSIDENISKLDDDAEHNAKIANEHGVEVAHHTATANGLFVLIGTFLGTFLSLLIVRGLSSTLGKTIADLNASSDAVSSASVQSSASATELSEASTQQAASLQQTMASVEQISAMVSQNAESAGKVQGAVDLNQQSADEGSKSVGDMMTAIDEIKVTNDKILTQMEESNREFGAIVKIISEIGEKTKVINDIVFQTKLLSFNASVEAARAGEHGKGFAVVAEEVGNLAQMSGNAAKQITDMLSDSIKKVNEIVDQTTRRVDQLVEVGKDKISMGQATAQRCREALSKISNNAQTMATMIGEITHASKEQAQGVQEINKAMSQLDQVTQQNAAVAQQSSQQAELLNSQAQSLSSAVSSLVSLVNGGNSHAEVPQAGPRAKVTPIAHARAAHKAAPARTAKMKQAVGARTPSANDPAFEEF